MAHPARGSAAAVFVGSLLPSNPNDDAQVTGKRRISLTTLYYVDAPIEFAFGIHPNPSKPPLPKGTLDCRTRRRPRSHGARQATDISESSSLRG